MNCKYGNVQSNTDEADNILFRKLPYLYKADKSLSKYVISLPFFITFQFYCTINHCAVIQDRKYSLEDNA